MAQDQKNSDGVNRIDPDPALLRLEIFLNRLDLKERLKRRMLL